MFEAFQPFSWLSSNSALLEAFASLRNFLSQRFAHAGRRLVAGMFFFCPSVLCSFEASLLKCVLARWILDVSVQVILLSHHYDSNTDMITLASRDLSFCMLGASTLALGDHGRIQGHSRGAQERRPWSPGVDFY